MLSIKLIKSDKKYLEMKRMAHILHLRQFKFVVEKKDKI